MKPLLQHTKLRSTTNVLIQSPPPLRPPSPHSMFSINLKIELCSLYVLNIDLELGRGENLGK